MEERVIGFKGIIENGKISIVEVEIEDFNKGYFCKVFSKDSKGIERRTTVMSKKFDALPLCSIGKVVLYSRCKKSLECNCKEYIKKLSEEYIPNKIKESEKEIDKIKKTLEEIEKNEN